MLVLRSILLSARPASDTSLKAQIFFPTDIDFGMQNRVPNGMDVLV